MYVSDLHIFTSNSSNGSLLHLELNKNSTRLFYITSTYLGYDDSTVIVTITIQKNKIIVSTPYNAAQPLCHHTITTMVTYYNEDNKLITKNRTMITNNMIDNHILLHYHLSLL